MTELLEEGAYVVINFGAHPLCDGAMMDSLEQFDDWLAFVNNLLDERPAHRRRLAWLGSYPRPVMGYYYNGGLYVTANMILIIVHSSFIEQRSAFSFLIPYPFDNT